jgi:peptide deformylase
MALLEIITMPHPILEMRARDVEEDEFGEELATKMSDMAETMYAAPGVGLAAPQVADPRRFVVVDPGEDGQRGVRLFQMVNPVITERSAETISWRETCLSVPDISVEVQRNKHITVEWRTPMGEPRSEQFSEYEAVIIQHELDHLEGVVLLERVSRFKRSRWLKRQKKLQRAGVLAG